MGFLQTRTENSFWHSVCLVPVRLSPRPSHPRRPRASVLVGTMRYFRTKVYFESRQAPEHLFLPNQFQKCFNSVSLIGQKNIFSEMTLLSTSSRRSVNRASARCSRGHGFDSCWGLGIPALFHARFIIEVKFDVYGKRQTAKIKLVPSVFTALYSRIKIFEFAMNSKRLFYFCMIYLRVT